LKQYRAGGASAPHRTQRCDIAFMGTVERCVVKPRSDRNSIVSPLEDLQKTAALAPSRAGNLRA
jgi:hypothetical protein